MLHKYCLIRRIKTPPPPFIITTVLVVSLFWLIRALHPHPWELTAALIVCFFIPLVVDLEFITAVLKRVRVSETVERLRKAQSGFVKLYENMTNSLEVIIYNKQLVNTSYTSMSRWYKSRVAVISGFL